jgi:hypothetical protein
VASSWSSTTCSASRGQSLAVAGNTMHGLRTPHVIGICGLDAGEKVHQLDRCLPASRAAPVALLDVSDPDTTFRSQPPLRTSARTLGGGRAHRLHFSRRQKEW